MRDKGGDEGCDNNGPRADLDGPGLGVSGLIDRVGDPLEGVGARSANSGLRADLSGPGLGVGGLIDRVGDPLEGVAASA